MRFLFHRNCSIFIPPNSNLYWQHMKVLKPHIEALIFVAEPAITWNEIKDCLDEKFEADFSEEEILQVIDHLIDEYREKDTAFEIVEMNGGFRFMTKPIFKSTLTTYLKQSENKKLSKTAMETLSIIAYKQPVTKAVVEQIRGVNCDYTIKRLLERELISIVGRAETIGKPLLYGTSDKFMDYFGLKNINDLPKLKDFEDKRQIIGDNSAVAGEALKNTSEN